MDSTSFVDTRKDIFARPKARRDIIRGRKILSVNRFEDIVPALEERKADEVVSITQEVNIIPVDEKGVPKYYSAQNFSKRGPLVKLQTFTKEEQIERKWSDLKARIDAEARYKNSSDSRFVGWYWFDPEGYAHIVQPWVVLEGTRLEMFAYKSRNIDDKIKFKKSYTSRDSNLISVLMDVPSRSEKSHLVLLEHLTRLKDPAKYLEWTRFRTNHSCGFKQGDFGFRFDKMVTYCPHDVAAHRNYSRRVAEKSGMIVPQPFPMFTESTLRLYLSAIYDTIKIDETSQGIRSRALSLPEINPLLMDAWRRYGNKSTFFVRSMTKNYKTGPAVGERKRMADYNWQNSAAGIKFERY